MLEPNYLLHISEGAEDISEALHNEIIKRIINRIMLRISRNDDYILTAYDKWNIETLQQAGYLLEDIQKEIAKATKLQEKEIAEAMEEAGVESLSYDDKIYESVGLSPTPLTQSPELIRLMQRNYEATLGEWHNFTRTTADISQQLFISELDKFYMLVSTGAMGYTQALKEIIDTVVSDGVRVYYDTGHSDTIETATLRAVRTGISQMSAQIQMKRMDEMDVDLVITSSHLGARPSHAEWQGRIFSRSGRGNYPNFEESTGYGTVSGLCGANCRHSFSPFFEAMDNPFEQYDTEENRKQYEKEQRQRTLERRIRKTKREVMGWKEAVDAETDDKAKFELDLQYQKKASLLQRQNEAYQEYCEKNNLRPLADRITIARWNRQQAAAASGAAKRYENAHGGSKKKNIIRIEQSNKIATKAIKESYEYRRVVDKVQKIPFSDIEKDSSIGADFLGMDLKLADASAKQFEKLSKEYDTVCEAIEVGKLDVSSTPGGTEYSSYLQRAKITLNRAVVKDYDSFMERMDKAVKRNQFPKMPNDNYDKYVITHEFAHTLFDFDSSLKNIVGADTSAIKKARKEIREIQKKYKEEVLSLENRLNSLFSENIDQDDLDTVFKQMDLIEKVQKDIEKIKISNYAEMDIEEFMAEAFADAKLGSNPSKYSIQVSEVIDKYFKKKKK